MAKLTIDEKIDDLLDETIESLLIDAGEAGDEKFIATCRAALLGSREAKRIVVRVIDDALAMQD